MADRLTSLDTSFLYMEDVSTVMHVGAVMVFDPPEHRIDHDRVLALVGQRIAHLPRYRQRIKWVPGHLANPVWVDDDSFDLALTEVLDGDLREGAQGVGVAGES